MVFDGYFTPFPSKDENSSLDIMFCSTWSEHSECWGMNEKSSRFYPSGILKVLCWDFSWDEWTMAMPVPPVAKQLGAI
jgi:hypothetical protein